MSALRGKKILIFQQRNWGKGIGHGLAKKLQAEGCRLAALTLKRTTHDLILQQNEVRYDLIVGNDEIMSDPKKYLAGERYSLEEICRELDISSIWPAVSAMRHHVRSYKDKFYYSFRQNVSDEGIIDYIMATYKYIKMIFEEFRPDLIITPNFASMPHIMFNLYARKRGVSMIGLTDSKVAGYYFFTHSYLNDRGPFYSRVDALNSGKADSKNRDKAKQYIREFRIKLKSQTYIKPRAERTFWQKIRREFSPFYQILKYFTRRSENYLESTDITMDYRPPRIILRDFYARKRYEKFMESYEYYPLEKLGKFVYFPLQVQPEESIDVNSPFFSNQIETARLAAQSLPGDYTLVVKEHPGMYGLRPPSYLEKIARTPNVKLVDFRIASETLIKRADLIIGPSGTTLAEAAFHLKPVIQLGDLGTTLKFPTIFKHTDMPTLSAKIMEILKMDLKTPDNERRLENFVAAVYDTGFEYDYFRAWESGKGNHEELWQIFRQEISRELNT